MRILLNSLKNAYMEQKCLYSSLSRFLQLNEQDKLNDYVFRDVEVLSLYYEILSKVEKDPFRYWNISSLRNYIKYFYKLSEWMTQKVNEDEAVSKPDTARDLALAPFNIYAESELAIFFTGLYSKFKNKGCKEGLFVVCQKQADNNIHRRVMTYSELRTPEFTKYLDDITIASTFDEYFYLAKFSLQTIKKIEGLSEFDYKNYYTNEKNGNHIDTRLHILIDGVDNIPLDYLRILYNIEPDRKISFGNKKDCDNVIQIVSDSAKKESEKSATFLEYQSKMIKAINVAIEKAQNDNKFSQLPLNFYVVESNKPFQYLLPIDFTETGNPDFCACVSVDTSGTGRLKTILNMNEVYGNVRVFGKDAVESVKDWWV